MTQAGEIDCLQVMRGWAEERGSPTKARSGRNIRKQDRKKKSSGAIYSHAPVEWTSGGGTMLGEEQPGRRGRGRLGGVNAPISASLDGTAQEMAGNKKGSCNCPTNKKLQLHKIKIQ